MDIALVPCNSPLTASAEEGRQLAIKLARLVIKLTQPGEVVRSKLHDAYANDASMSRLIGHTVAIEFATIAAANNYWRK